MTKKIFLAVFAFSFFGFSAFAQRVISPVSGNFNNKQVLVIDTSDGAECYYSFSGTDPLTSGFAYDGPVLIDSIGRSNVRVVAVKGEDREEIEINFNVQEENPFAEGSAESNFISETAAPGLFTYSYENPVNIPAGLNYCLGDGNQPYLKGQSLSINPANRLSRYIPCHVTDGKNEWRFVIFVTGGDVGTLSKYAVPFELSDWNTFTYTGDKLIWNIDDSDWSASRVPVKLDRSVKHTVRWQSVAYEKGNPVTTYVIPAEPQLLVNEKEGQAATFAIDGDLRYRMELVSTGLNGMSSDIKGTFTSAVFDTFEGDSISGEAEFAFYADGVYQGSKKAAFNVDKKPPLPPVFKSSSDTFYARDAVSLELSAENGSKIFYAVSSPFKVSEEAAESAGQAEVSDAASENDDSVFDAVEAGNFMAYDGPIELDSGSESAVFYKVRAYSVDEKGNSSSISEYRVVIDEYNYYLDASADETMAEGSRKNPFTNLLQAVEVINSGRFAHFYVRGTFNLPQREVIISSNCAFTGLSDARFIIPENGSLVVRNSSLEAHHLILEKTRGASMESNGKFISLENSTMRLEDCEAVSIFAENGTMFSASKSVIELVNSGLTVQADSYACAVSALDSKVYSKNSRISSVAQTAVNFSVTGGQFECRKSECKVTAHLGRVAELTGTNARITDNNFTAQLDKKIRGVVAVWKDKNTLLLEDKNNSEAGF